MDPRKLASSFNTFSKDSSVSKFGASFPTFEGADDLR